MTPNLIDILAMLGLFFAGFAMWVAWELISGRKLLSIFLAIGTFIAAWQVAKVVGLVTPVWVLLVEALTAAVLVRVANNKTKNR